MEAKRLEYLISGYLSGTLSEAEAAELAELVRDSAEARAVAAKHFVVDRLVRGAAMEPVDADRVMRALGSCASGEVADRVLERLGQETPRRGTRRIPRRRAAGPPGRGWWVSLMLAASVLLLLTLAVTRNESPRRIEKRNDKIVAAPTPDEKEPAPRVPDRADRPVAPAPRREEPAPVKPPDRPEEPRPATPDRPAVPEPKPSPAKPPEEPAPPPAPKPPEPSRTVALVQATTVESLEGEVYLVAKAARTPVKAGDAIPEGLGVQTVGRQSRTVVRFADGTKVELQPDTEVREILEVLGARGKRLTVVSGTIDAEVKEQPKDRPLLIGTPHGEAKVLGTTLRIVVDLSGKGSTRLEVKEGKVQLRRKSDGRVIEVMSGYFAIASAGLELGLRRLRPAEEPPRADGLPFDASCPVIYTNDGLADAWTDEYVIALASAGDIELCGILTSSSEAPFNPYGAPDGFRQLLLTRVNLVKAARNSGFRWLPDPVAGPLRHLEKPASGRIEDTRPIGAPGSLLIVREARKATSQHPLVVAAGGPINAAADAFLLDPSIADKVVVACVGNGQANYDGYASWCDPWAGWIVFQKLRVVYFPQVPAAHPVIAPEKFAELPESEFKRWLTMFRTDPAGAPKTDGDAPPALAVVRSDYVLRSKRVSVAGTTPSGTPPREAPLFKDDPTGNVWVVLEVSGAVATEEWWRALKNPAAWGRKPK